MSHTPLLQTLRRLAVDARESALTGRELEQIAERRAALTTRRAFIGQMGVAAAVLTGAPILRAGKPVKSKARVVIVGAGLAGLTCGYRLKQAGVDATVYEAKSSVGGRCHTLRNYFLEGQIAEHGGELIDQSHTSIRQLAQELKLPLDNVLAAEPNHTEAFFHFCGSPYPYKDATGDLKAIWQTLHRDLSEASYPTLHNQSTPRGRQLDKLSIIDWINQTIPGGVHSRLGRLLDVAYTIEYGAECAEQSALNLLYLLGYNSPGQFTLFGASNEKYHVRGGNDRIVSTLASVLAGQIVTGHALIKAVCTAGGAFELTFQTAQGTKSVTADKVVFALPFSILREVNYAQAGFSELKKTAITELPMGANSKLNVQFSRRHWHTLGCNGDSMVDTGYQATWEVSRAQRGTAGILVEYSGGNHALTLNNGTADQQANIFLSQAATVLPGLASYYNGKAMVDFWPGNPFTKGSYSYWKVGQYTRFAGIEGVPEGNAHFCGEHTSIDAQGYLEGAVETGERVAEEITADLRV